MIDDFGFGTFRTKDGRLLYGRIIRIGERITTLKVIGFNSIHRLAHKNVASVGLQLTLAEMKDRNLKAPIAARRKRKIDLETRERKRLNILDEWGVEGPPRWHRYNETTH